MTRSGPIISLPFASPARRAVVRFRGYSEAYPICRISIFMHESCFDLILVRPSVPENVGMTARAMQAFGFERLTLVSPAFEWNPDGPVCKTACGSKSLLARARIVDRLEDAVAECHRVAGFSRREHDFERPRCDLGEWIDNLECKGDTVRTALVFGPENFGLSNADKRNCDVLVSIPTHHPTLSLNLAQAVTLVLFEIFRGWRSPTSAPPAAFESRAVREDIQRIVDTLTGLLDRTNFFKTGRRERQIETLRNLIFRLQLSVSERDTILGVLHALNAFPRDD